MSGPELVQKTTDQIQLIKDRLKAAQDRQKSYADIRRRPLEFQEERIGPVAYKLELPEEMKGIHNIFHVSNLRKCLADEMLAMLLKDVQVNDKLKFVEQPIQIEDSMVKFLKKRRLKIVKVRWDSRRGPEYTGELESEMKKKYPHLFQ
ncbi:uncharacterized protein LOC143577904 [Bidens hawaiensis]|uniref:uncharacterized protein LOC143577904 n=1 Tax=Bidens hawaiensis TaxID=980011 RepID=UPI00404A3727